MSGSTCFESNKTRRNMFFVAASDFKLKIVLMENRMRDLRIQPKREGGFLKFNFLVTGLIIVHR